MLIPPRLIEITLNISLIMVIDKPSTTTYIDKCEEYCAVDARASKMKASTLATRASSSSSKLSRKRIALSAIQRFCVRISIKTTCDPISSLVTATKIS